VIVGGVYAVKGSANRFPPRGRQQENGPSLSRNAVIAAVTAPFSGPITTYCSSRWPAPSWMWRRFWARRHRPRCPRGHPPRRPEAAKGHL